MASHVLETLWPCHWERIYTIQVDYPLSHPEFYARAHPDIADFNVLSDEMQGDVRYYLCEFIAATEIPPVVRHVVRPDMLNWTQEAWWRGATHTSRARDRPHNITPPSSPSPASSTSPAATPSPAAPGFAPTFSPTISTSSASGNSSP